MGGEQAATTLDIVARQQAERAKALLAAQTKLGVKPRILVAPGFTHVHPADPAGAAAATAARWCRPSPTPRTRRSHAKTAMRCWLGCRAWPP